MRARNLTVAIIDRDNQGVIIQHDDRRYFCPVDKLKGNEISESDLEKCTLYGEDWRTWMDGPGADEFAAQLYAARIYTRRDFLAGSAEARAALQRVLVNPLLEEMLKRAAKR
jgi:hypothetical protein